MRAVRFGIIGCGLMGREFASEAARRCHIAEVDARPEIVAVYDTNPAITAWFAEWFDSVRHAGTDYCEVLDKPDVEAVYIAVHHHLHVDFYCATIETGKRLIGDKPLGVEILGTQASARWLSAHADILEIIMIERSEQVWGQIQTGHETAHKIITGGIFQFGFTDLILQMRASYLHELQRGQPNRKFAGCVTPDETALSHRLFSAAFASHGEKQVYQLES